MSELIASSELIAVVGMGATGVSVARFLKREKQRFIMLDTRQTPPNLERFIQEFPGVPFELGALSEATLRAASKIVLSPGIALREPAIQAAGQAGVPVLGDIQLFAEKATAPIIAITGSNGKSTVTTLVGEMLKAAGRKVAVGGNLGTPALDLLADDNGVECFVLELSSFQLETTGKLNAEVATILNLSADHMDRYAGMADYHLAKQRVFFGAKKMVVNRDDPLTRPPMRADAQVISFGLDRPDLKQFGLLEEGGELYLAQGLSKLTAARELKIAGKHNLANALAALAIGHFFGLQLDVMLDALRSFAGLPHRCEWVAESNGVVFINDSKGTNVGATLAAVQGLSRLPAKIVLIAGGEGKGADFAQLGSALAENVRALVSIGTDGEKIAAVARERDVDVIAADGMKDAVEKARDLAQRGDVVLLSPACASFDMFKNYMDRGDHFCRAVREVLA
ncbi:UDP-N-acetylmuramoyl-L-alanine--D-glutamate ligase [Proteobacteria bacterium 005FR1]|nr:UDP-N-acetylmuramoyl-L-alanine--D-glutamate ligase [Proteobacteria bacterium 005FR1]